MWKQHSKHIWSHLCEETLEENPNYWISFVWFIRIPSNSAPASFGPRQKRARCCQIRWGCCSVGNSLSWCLSLLHATVALLHTGTISIQPSWQSQRPATRPVLLLSGASVSFLLEKTPQVQDTKVKNQPTAGWSSSLFGCTSKSGDILRNHACSSFITSYIQYWYMYHNHDSPLWMLGCFLKQCEFFSRKYWRQPTTLFDN